MSAACSKACAAKPENTPTVLTPQPNARVGDFVRCPVSGVIFQITSKSITHKLGTDHLFFCCAGCKSRFLAEPDKFVALTG